MKRKLIALIPIIIAIATIVFLAKTKAEPKKIEKINEKVVKIETLKTKDTNIYIKSFGSVSSKEDINFISSVSGDVLYKNPKISEGIFIKKGTLLLAIDDKEYILNLKNLEAQIASAKASKKELEKELENTKILIDIEKQRLLLDKKELDKHLKIKTHISDSTISSFKNQVLARQNSLQNLKSSLEILPLRIKAGQANIEALEARKEIAKISLKDCKIYMPFDGVLYDITVQKNEYINMGTKLFKAYNNSKMQIELEIAASHLAKFDDYSNIKVDLFSTALNKTYKTTFVNLSKNVDEKTRTLRLLFSIDETIFKGIFLDAKILVKEYKDVISIPKNLYKNEKVAIFKNNTLHFKKVKILQENLESYIVEGLNTGDKLILSNIPDAIEGMKLKVIE